MKRPALLAGLLLSLSLACSLPLAAPVVDTPQSPVVITPPGEPVTATTSPTAESPTNPPATVAPPSANNGVSVTAGNVSFTIPTGLASGINDQDFPPTFGTQVAPWEVMPGHLEVALEGYVLQGHFHQPKLYVFPAADYVALIESLNETYARIRAATANPTGLTAQAMPGIPFFNAAQMLAARMQTIQFKNGSGVRMLTQYGQGFGPINNHALFYHFQGMTSDGKYYLIAILPVNAPMLAADENPGANPPAGGVPFNYNDANFDIPGYIQAVTGSLDGTAASAFTPGLDALDSLIQSIQVNP